MYRVSLLESTEHGTDERDACLCSAADGFLDCVRIGELPHDDGYVVGYLGGKLGGIADVEGQGVAIAQGGKTEVNPGRAYLVLVTLGLVHESQFCWF